MKKGYIMTIEHKQKLSLAHKGKKKPWASKNLKNRGIYTRTSNMKTGKNPNSHISTPEIIQKRLDTMKKRGIKIGKWNVGKKHTIETKMRVSQSNIGKHCGEKSGWWKGGYWTRNLTVIQKLKMSPNYSEWRLKVYERDRFTCQECGQVGGKLHAHHKKRFVDICRDNNITTVEQGLNCEELWDVNNGLTLDKQCHEKTENYGNCKNKLVIIEKTK